MLVIVIDPRSDGRWLVEVQGRSRHRGQLAGGDESGVDGGVAVRGNHHQVVENVSLPFAGKVEVAVIGQIQDRVLIGGGKVLDLERMRFQRIADPRGQGAGKTLIAILADQGELHPMGNFMPLPQQLVEAYDSPVQGVDAVVCRKLIALAVQAKGGMGDAVAVAPDDGSEVAFGIGGVARQGS